MNLVYTKASLKYLDNLIILLYEKNYFGFKEYAHKYVESLTEGLKDTIHLKQKHKASNRYLKYGQNLYYITYPKNKRTTWYFFFTYHPAVDLYIIRYITNNHVEGHLL